MDADEGRRVRLLCPKKSLLPSSSSPGIRWLIGSPLFLPPLTVVASFRCLHALPGDPFSPDFSEEADDIRALLLKGFDIVGALYVGCEEDAQKVIESSRRMRLSLFGEKGSYDMLAALANVKTGDICFFVSDSSKPRIVEASNVVYEDNPENYLWERGCLVRCELAFKLPIYVPVNKKSDAEANFSSLLDTTVARLRDPSVAYLVEGPLNSEEEPHSIVLHGRELDFSLQTSSHTPLRTNEKESSKNTIACSHFCSKKRSNFSSTARESADAIRVTVLFNQSRNSLKMRVPIAEYLPASEPAMISVISLKLDVLCYTSKDFPVAAAVSKLIMPGCVDQLDVMKKAAIPELLSQHPQLSPYHFLPPGLFIPVTAIYELSYGETEEKQGEIRKSLHLRLGLPLDRPLLRIANALSFSIRGSREGNLTKDGSSLLRDVHTGIPSSGVSGGIISLIDGSYEYYHYLLDGIDDNGWGCAYRSLQTIISWYRLQQYTSIDVPSHRKIQQALVEIGDKDPSFIGSREWIGAIELSFVLDKLLGVSCKIINVRSGEELPEKCRELARHFETQGTPVMIGGGVLAYTLLGVEYNEASGDCAFLILDPHYTGNDDLKKIVNGGWCGWKKAVDSKGRNFFLKDKFYNLLLPQRPNMV
ncbi:probable Ufm1-specific protease isoform X1 [Typha latifolia]|uniref:probable Ufm1-specific protease isoform X1 n=1 Tax=Typha latifolia TaxID=4733 RepID=UPI003C2BD7E1